MVYNIGAIGWPDLTEWLGGMNSPMIGAKLMYNFTDDVRWTGLSTFPPEYEVPNCRQCIEASKYS